MSRKVTPCFTGLSGVSFSESREFECGAEVRGEFALGGACSCGGDGGELPHAGEQDVVVGAGISHEQRAFLRIEKDGGGDVHLLLSRVCGAAREFRW